VKARVLLVVAGLAAAGCGVEEAPSRARPATPPPADPAATTDWHKEPVLSRAASRNVAFLNHADATLRPETIVADLQRQYEWLAEYVGVAPPWLFVHAGAKYPCGFAVPSEPHPEMFLVAAKIYDTSNDYAHEMTHCFTFRYGRLPHWFGESICDVTFADAEIELWKRRLEPWLEGFDRVDHRSYELMTLRRKYGRAYFPKVFRSMEKRADECRRTFAQGVALEEQNRLLLAILSEAAGEDLVPLFTKEFGFNPRTRERQRGY
jgi:hypothetical protein